jgi:hypothetical protein
MEPTKVDEVNNVGYSQVLSEVFDITDKLESIEDCVKSMHKNKEHNPNMFMCIKNGKTYFWVTYSTEASTMNPLYNLSAE